MKSIQKTLVSGLLVSLIIVFLLLWLIVSHNIQNLSEDYISSRIKHDIETLITAISFDKDNNILLNEQYINSIYKRPFSGHYYIIQNQQTSIRSRSLWDQTLNITVPLNTGYKKSYQTGPENQPLIILTGNFVKQSKQVTISIGEDLTPVTQSIKQFKNYFSIIAATILICLLLIQVIVLKRGLQPLKRIRTELSQLEKGDITHLSSDVPDELETIVNEINHLSLALNKRIKRSRDALSDLSHAIKKPLTVLQQFNDQHATLNNEDKNTLGTQIESIHQITDRILKRARIAGQSQTGKRFDINDDLNILIKTIRMMYPDKNIDTDVMLMDNLQINIDREDMLELLGNLLDNAWKWASKKIIITATQNHQIHIIIEDDGTGQDAESLNQLIDRGFRLDESVSGYGFGLAISSDIIKDYQGTLTFSRSEILGGFKVEIAIPTSLK